MLTFVVETAGPDDISLQVRPNRGDPPVVFDIALVVNGETTEIEGHEGGWSYDIPAPPSRTVVELTATRIEGDAPFNCYAFNLDRGQIAFDNQPEDSNVHRCEFVYEP